MAASFEDGGFEVSNAYSGLMECRGEAMKIGTDPKPTKVCTKFVAGGAGLVCERQPRRGARRTRNAPQEVNIFISCTEYLRSMVHMYGVQFKP